MVRFLISMTLRVHWGRGSDRGEVRTRHWRLVVLYQEQQGWKEGGGVRFSEDKMVSNRANFF